MEGKIANITPLERLEGALTECRDFLRKLGTELAKERRHREMSLRLELEEMLLQVPSNSEQEARELMRKIEETTQKIGKIEEKAAKNHQINAGLKWEAEGDRPSSFFFNKAQGRKARRYIEGLYSTGKKLATTQTDLENVVVEAFTKLFRSKGSIAKWKAKWEEVLPKVKEKVTRLQKEILDRDLTAEELKQALCQMPSGKCSGLDGFPKEFYQAYWGELQDMVVDAVSDAWKSESLGEFFNIGIICLCPKSSDLHQVDQWRPITLLPTLYKIVAKALAIRLKPFMDIWLEPEQRGFVSGRSIADNLMLFREAKYHAFTTKQKVAFLQLDFSKAYDTVEWHFMQECLKAMGFGEKFCNWIRILCADSGSKVLVNGKLTRRLGLQRSVWQGCPLVPYIFVLLADLVIIMVKEEPDIVGMTLPNKEMLKAMTFADDNQLVSILTALSLNAYNRVIMLFCAVSGLMINWKKTVAICCPKPLPCLPGDLNFVRILPEGEAQR